MEQGTGSQMDGDQAQDDYIVMVRELTETEWKPSSTILEILVAIMNAFVTPDDSAYFFQNNLLNSDAFDLFRRDPTAYWRKTEDQMSLEKEKAMKPFDGELEARENTSLQSASVPRVEKILPATKGSRPEPNHARCID